MPVYRMTMRWQGFSGAPGFTNLYFNFLGDPTQADIDATGVNVKAFFEGVKTFIPSTVTVSYPGIMDRLTTGTGDLEAEINMAVQTATTGTGVGNFSSAVGACVNWTTVAIVRGRRVRGRTFLVPLVSGAFQTDGTLGDTARTTMLAAANAFVAEPDGLNLAVWSRPTVAGNDGQSGEVVAASITDKTAVLRSRRD